MLKLGSSERQKHTPLINFARQRGVVPFGVPQLFSLLASHVVMLITLNLPTPQPLHKDFDLALCSRRRQLAGQASAQEAQLAQVGEAAQPAQAQTEDVVVVVFAALALADGPLDALDALAALEAS